MATTSHDRNEAVAVVTVILKAVQGTLAGQSGETGAKTNLLCGQLITNGSTELQAGGMQFWTDLRDCFEAAQQAGATFAGMGKVLTTIQAQAPVSRVAKAVVNFSTRMTLMEQARILAATTFTSRQQIDTFFAEIDASFQAAELVAADNFDNVAYVALINVHAAVSNDLANRAFALPVMVSYSFSDSMPSLWLAQRLYQDASRGDELIAENRPIHPLFMPLSGKALASNA